MKVNIEIDSNSGFCNGVVRAIDKAESYLRTNGKLFSLGDIVHNSKELERLKQKGLSIASYEDFNELHNTVVLIRAHGEPPVIYRRAEENRLRIIDCTCPVVLQLQRKVRDVYRSISKRNGQVVIFGKLGHAEVNGLVGQTEGNAIVIDSIESAAEKIDFSRPVALFSQTTKDPVEYSAVSEYVKGRSGDVRIFDTICRQVAHRHDLLEEFARNHSVVLFVSGRESSNGKVLYELCRASNPKSYWLEDSSQIEDGWFENADSVGICGATSTPKWQLEEIFVYLQDRLNNNN